MDRIYIEKGIADHPRTRAILDRHPKSTRIECERYAEVFNPRSQNFRLQKKRPALILAEKHGNSVLPTPPGYSIGSSDNFYFSHMLNCLYDCRYCFLQGMYQSAHFVHFVNYEIFEEQIDEVIRDSEGTACFFSGYDCDSLAMESMTGFAEHFVPFFQERPNACLELRTKSLNTGVLEKCEPAPNIIAAFTLSPDPVAKEFEHGAPSFERRLQRVESLTEQGWIVGLRLDPLIPWPGFEEVYGEMLNQIFERVPSASIHSVTTGGMRFPKAMYDRIVKLYPKDPLFALAEMKTLNGQVAFPPEVERGMLDFVLNRLGEKLPGDKIFEQV